jgi:hypothetical protein
MTWLTLVILFSTSCAVVNILPVEALYLQLSDRSPPHYIRLVLYYSSRITTWTSSHHYNTLPLSYFSIRDILYLFYYRSLSDPGPPLGLQLFALVITFFFFFFGGGRNTGPLEFYTPFV